MVLRNPRLLLVAMVFLATGLAATVQAGVREKAAPVFANYYVQDGDATAAMYLSPRPTPPLVGHTYITYQPLMPHEYLYPHCRTYVTRHPDAGRTVTRVHWGHHYFQGLVPHYIDGHFFHNILDHGN